MNREQWSEVLGSVGRPYIYLAVSDVGFPSEGPLDATYGNADGPVGFVWRFDGDQPMLEEWFSVMGFRYGAEHMDSLAPAVDLLLNVGVFNGGVRDRGMFLVLQDVEKCQCLDYIMESCVEAGDMYSRAMESEDSRVVWESLPFHVVIECVSMDIAQRLKRDLGEIEVVIATVEW